MAQVDDAMAGVGRRGTVLAVLALAGLLTGGRATATTIIPDPVGDSDDVVDITSVSAGFTATTLVLGGTFDPGTFDPATGGFNVGLDTDMDPNTGIDCSGGLNIFPCGSEWQVSYNASASTTMARLTDGIGGAFASFAVTFGTDSFEIVVPLNADPNLGLPDDGLALFGLVAGVVDFSTGSFGPEDIAPDSADEGPLGGPSSPIVPEPSAASLLTLALAAVFSMRRSAR